jgi:hypothetical protein
MGTHCNALFFSNSVNIQDSDIPATLNLGFLSWPICILKRQRFCGILGCLKGSSFNMLQVTLFFTMNFFYRIWNFMAIYENLGSIFKFRRFTNLIIEDHKTAIKFCRIF